MVIEKLGVEKFRGARPISQLNVFPMRFYPNSGERRGSLAARGQKFANLMDSQYSHNDGPAFFQRRDDLVRVSVNFRIILMSNNFERVMPANQGCTPKNLFATSACLPASALHPGRF